MCGLITTDHSAQDSTGICAMPSVMDISNWERLDGAPEKITRAEFERGYAERSRLSFDEFHRYLKALPCDCGEEDCEGWQAISMRTWKAEQRETSRRK